MGDFWYFMLQSSFLILVVLLIGKLGGKYLSPRVKYALWLIPMLRFVFPIPWMTLPETAASWHPYALVQEFEDAMRGMERVGNSGETELDRTAGQRTETAIAETMSGFNRVSPNVLSKDETAGNVISEDTAAGGFLSENQLTDSSNQDSIRKPRGWQNVYATFIKIFQIVWPVGSFLLAVLVVSQNIHFFRKIKHYGVKIEPDEICPKIDVEDLLNVYYIKDLPSPCLAGVFRPVILVNDKALADPEVFRMVLYHEQMHFKQKDPVWMVIRNVICIIYWFHPLVWVGAAVSKRDAELSCDSGVTAGMNKEERKQYGMALLELLSQKKTGSVLNGTTAMSGGKREIEERIKLIARQRKTKKWVVAVVLVCLGAAAVFSSTRVKGAVPVGGVMNKNEQSSEKWNNGTQNNETETAIVKEEKTDTNDEETDLTDIEVEISKKEALFSGGTNLGVDGPILDYIDDEVIIFSNYFGVVILQYGNLGKEEPHIIDTLDLSEIGCAATQGDDASCIRVSEDGKMLYIYSMSSSDLYRYDRQEKRLYRGDRSMLPEEENLYRRPENMSGFCHAYSKVSEGKMPDDMGYFHSDNWNIDDLSFVLEGDMFIRVWTESSADYMLNLKKMLEKGSEQVVDEGWGGGYSEPVENLKGGEPEWAYSFECVDENGNWIANPYEWTSYFEKLDGSIRLPFRRHDTLLYTYGEYLIYRYDETIYVITEKNMIPILKLSAGRGSTRFYSGEEGIGVSNNDDSTLTFYDKTFTEIRKWEQVRLEGYHEDLYCVLDLNTGLYGYLDNYGDIAIPFQYSVAGTMNNGYAAVLTEAEQEIYYEDKTVKMFNNIGGYWAVIDRNGNYVIEPDEKHSNSFDRPDVPKDSPRYINGPVRFQNVKEDGTVEFIRNDDGKVLYTYTLAVD